MKHLTLEDVQFCFAVEHVQGVIQVEQGLPLFYIPERGIIARYPGNLTHEDYGQTKSAWMYPATKKMKRKLGPDDIPIDDLQDSDVDLYSDVETVRALVEEERIRKISKVMGSCIGIFASFIVSIASFFLSKKSDLFLASLAASFVVLAVSILRTLFWSRILGSPIVYDTNGAWVNLETGECSLNGGCTLSQYAKEESAL